MDAGDADVVEAGDAGVEGLGGDGGLFGDGEVAAAGADDGDVAVMAGGSAWRRATVRAVGL
jgi:hypothetical protein